MEPTFSVSGLASGLDTANIVEEFTRIERRPIDLLRNRQEGLRTQVSTLGSIAGKLNNLEDAAQKLADDGVLGLSVASDSEAFTVASTSDSVAGRYDMSVGRLATAARGLSSGFSSGTEVQAGTLTLSQDGEDFEVTIEEGYTLVDVAAAIRDSGANVSAVVLNDGTQDYLSITNKDTGYEIGGAASSALTISESYTGLTGQTLGVTVTDATNAEFNINGLDFQRRTNSFSDAIPGTDITLREAGGGAETILIEEDTSGTTSNLEAFVNAYNEVLEIVQGQLSPTAEQDRDFTLAGDGAIRGLQRDLQELITTEVTGLSNITALADIGIKTGRDGKLSVDATTLESAISRDADAVNEIFSTATNGMGDVVEDLVSRYTNTVDGVLEQRKDGIERNVRDLDRQAESLEFRVAQYRENLQKQFLAMEQSISGIQSVGNFLAQQGGIGIL